MKKLFIPILLISTLASCGGNTDNAASQQSEQPQHPLSLAEQASGDIVAYESSDVNAVQQALPQIMVLFSDQTLKSFGSLKTTKVKGVTYTERDYKQYLEKDDRARRILSTIQGAFVKQNYPINDLEQTLKQLDTQAATDAADGIEKDAKTQILTTAQPDIILELDYKNSSNLLSHDYKNKNTNYTLSAIDAYTNKVLASITQSNIKGTSTTQSIQEDMTQQLPSLMRDITAYYSDILTRGREVTVRINVEKGSKQNLQSESIEGDTYTDWIIDYMKTHTVKGAYKMQRNTKNELYFVNVRIPLLQDDGTQYGVYDWTRDLQNNLRKNLGLQSNNASQGLGEVVLTVKGSNRK